MKKRGILLILLLFVVSACGPKGPVCEEAMKCKDSTTQAFQNKDCTWTDEQACEFGCENSKCRTGPRTEIRVSKADYEFLIKPTEDRNVKGIVTLEFTRFPEDIGDAAFAVTGGDVEDIKKTGPNIGYDLASSDGLSYIWDTTKFDNGLYQLYAFTYFEGDFMNDKDPQNVITTQVIIDN